MHRQWERPAAFVRLVTAPANASPLILLLAALAARARMARAAVAAQRAPRQADVAEAVGRVASAGQSSAAQVEVVVRLASAAPASAAQVEALARVVSTAVPMAGETQWYPTRVAPLAERMQWLTTQSPTVEEMRSRPTRAARHGSGARVAAAIWGRPVEARRSCRSFCWALRSYGR